MKSPRTSDDIEEVASLWVSRMDRDDWSPELEAELEAWLSKDPRCHGALLRAQSIWIALDGTTEVTSGSPADKLRISPVFRRRAWFGGALAAVAASLALVILQPSSGNIYATQLGEIRQVPLADGSSASINSDTSLEMEVKADRRLVKLARGEAWFKVKKNPHQPFIVEAGQVRIQAVGTAFSVRNVPGGAEVLVTEGVIKAWSESDKARSIVVQAGGRAFVASDSRMVQHRSNAAELERELAWREGKIDLVSKPLADAVSEFNRYNERKIVLEDPKFSGERIDGVFRTDDPEGFALAVQQLLGLAVDLSDPKVIRLS